MVADEPRLAGLTAAIGEQVTVFNLDLQAVQGQVSVLALPPEYPPVFGRLVADDDGRPLDLSELAPGQVYANADAARQLGAGGRHPLGATPRMARSRSGFQPWSWAATLVAVSQRSTSSWRTISAWSTVPSRSIRSWSPTAVKRPFGARVGRSRPRTPFSARQST